jgi:hypothetical protein
VFVFLLLKIIVNLASVLYFQQHSCFGKTPKEYQEKHSTDKNLENFNKHCHYISGINPGSTTLQQRLVQGFVSISQASPGGDVESCSFCDLVRLT